MKEYEVIIDLSSKHLIVEANNKEEAKEKAIKEYEKIIKTTEPMAEDYWIGECDEIN